MVLRWGVFAVTATHTQKHETRWINAGELTVGATVRDAAGEVGVVEALVIVDAPQVMYGLTVARVSGWCWRK